jgi:two-component system cell cycle sensor histidine kinase/response regulator CckA
VIINLKKMVKSSGTPCIEKNLPSGEYIVLEVNDTGSGIATEHLPNIFKRFFSTKDPDKGTGLGLATCWDLMEKWGGGIQIESQLGKGTRIKLWFPEYKGPHDKILSLSDEEGVLAQKSSPQSIQQRILLVEDEDPVRLFASRSLRGHGYIVDEAREGKRALELIQENRYSLLITDVIMPGPIDGLKLAEQGHKICPELKLLFVSGYEQDHVLQDIKDCSQVSFLQKPFSMQDLINKVSEIIDLDLYSEKKLHLHLDSTSN